MKKLLLIALLAVLTRIGFCQWQPKGIGVVPAGFFVSHIQEVNDSVIWAIALSHHAWINGPTSTHIPAVLRSTDGGDTWTMQQLPGSAGHITTAMSALDAQTMYYISANVSSGHYVMVYTTDGGLTWNTRSDADAANGLGFCFHIFNELEFASHGWGHYASYTLDGGNSWSVAPSPPLLSNEHLFLVTGSNFMAVNGTSAWVPTSRGRVYRTTNKGQSWSAVNTSFYPDRAMHTLAFTDSLNGLGLSFWNADGSGAQPKLASTLDGGLTWHTLNSLVDKFTNISAIPELPGGYIATTSVLVNNPPMAYYTLDHGQNWYDFDNPNNYEFGSLHFRTSQSGWASHTGPANASSPVAYKWTGAFTSAPKQASVQGSMRIFPNPASQTTQVKFASVLASASDAQIRILDSTGRVVMHQQVSADAGINTIELNLARIPAGLYMVKLEHGDTMQYSRLVVQ